MAKGPKRHGRLPAAPARPNGGESSSASPFPPITHDSNQIHAPEPVRFSRVGVSGSSRLEAARARMMAGARGRLAQTAVSPSRPPGFTPPPLRGRRIEPAPSLGELEHDVDEFEGDDDTDRDEADAPIRGRLEEEIDAPSSDRHEKREAPASRPPSTAPAPPVARSEQPSPAPHLQFRALRLADVDRLWDWIRQDPDKGQGFLGQRLSSSLHLHQLMQQILTREQEGSAWLRVLEYATHHLGFAVLFPILPVDRVGVVHLYLAPRVRGSLQALLPALLAHASEQRPDLRLVVMTDRPEYACLLGGFGFRQQLVLIKD